jgi:site-specific recombinase XerC
VAGNLERSGVSELVGTSCTENRKRAALLDVLAALANKGHDTRAIQGWLSHRSITSTAVYTALAPNRFKDFWRE